MPKRTIVIESPCWLSLRSCQMVVSFPEDERPPAIVPVEDMGYLIVDNQQAHFTMPLLAELAANNVAVLVCDNKHNPCSMLLNLDSHNIQGERFREQLEASQPAMKQVWKLIVERKILNQAALLRKYKRVDLPLPDLAKSVRSGDSDNREGVAAHIYWARLLGEDFVRSRFGDGPNGLLNYGYTVLRAAVARAICGAGMLPVRGIHHRNRYNSFPLADDLMEPYRPYVDDAVMELLADSGEQLDTEAKKHILGVLVCDVVVDGRLHLLSQALQLTCTSVAAYLAGRAKKLALSAFK